VGIDWDSFDGNKLTDKQALTIKYNAITERAADQAARMFREENRDDADFSQFIDELWYPEEQQHSAVLIAYLERFRPSLVPTQIEIDKIDEVKYDENPRLNTLMLHLCGEIRLGEWYAAAAKWHTEPLIQDIYTTLSKDETRHSVAYRDYMKKAISEYPTEARIAVVNVGLANILAEDK
jgi:tRNA isopentenyl-2-thiomethyl-A-37 hydroxylase MiaE